MCAPSHESVCAIDIIYSLISLASNAGKLHVRPHCPLWHTDTATVIAALTCSFPALLARLLFLPARDERTKRCHQRLTQEREQLFLLAGVAASPSKRSGKLSTTSKGSMVKGQSLSQRVSTVLKSGDFPESPEMPLHGSRISLHQVMGSGGELSADSLYSEGGSSGSRGGLGSSIKSSMRGEGGEVHSIQLHPSQLILLPDGISIGFQAPGGNTAHKIAIVPATRVGTPWRELRSARFRVEHGAEGLQYLTADDLQAHHATAVLVGGAASNLSPPPLTRWGCSAKLGLVWLYSGLLLLTGWFGLLLLARVALPRSCALRGVSEDEAWGRARSAMAFGLLNVFIILDSLKVVVLVLTGPGITSRIMRIKNPRLRSAVRQAVQTLHLPMAIVCP